MQSGSYNILFNEDFLSKNVKDKINIIVFGEDNKVLVKKLLKINAKLNITKVKAGGDNHDLLEKVIEYEKNHFDLCILNFPFNKNLEEILSEVFNNIATSISLPVIKKEYSISKFFRLCKRKRIGITNVSFYKGNKEISGLFVKYFSDKVLITINKSVHSFVYEEEFIKRKLMKLMKLLKLGRKIPAFSGSSHISEKR
jgi:hypothetical protein